ncbi:hypothetical protein [Streptomyces bangladeshensis]|uniref:Uncharacterized protein n=1 Tax=Streptomyces bangladeshensis TaxID=295352 RepID=A0ABP5N465_9ACTN
MTSTPDPIAYGPTGYRCGCGKPAHSNLVPCAADLDLARVGETVKVATAEAVGAELPHGIAALIDDAPALVAEVRRLRARVWELERPAVEAKRAEVRDSYLQLAAQCREDRDHEGAFDVDCRLREREEQWAREDAAVLPPSGA